MYIITIIIIIIITAMYKCVGMVDMKHDINGGGEKFSMKSQIPGYRRNVR
jgi:hypothetical protein